MSRLLRGCASHVLAAAALLAAPAAALTVDAFPLWHIERDSAAGRSVTELLWRIVEWRTDGDHTLRAVRPLFAWEADASEGWRALDVLWPFLIWRRENIGDPERESSHLRILPFFDRKRRASPDLAPSRLTIFPFVYAGQTGPSPHQGHFILFPLWWRGRDTRVYFPIFWNSHGSFRALFPLLGHFDDLWGRDSVDFFLWPLWSRSRRGEAVTDTVLWPFFARTRGGNSFGLRAWPLFAQRGVRGESVRGFYLWPLGHFRRGTRRDGRPDNLHFFLPFRLWWEIGDTRLDVWWPWRGTYESPGHDTWSFAWPLHMHTVNRRHDFEEVRLLWFLFRRQWGPTRRATELFPIAGRRESPDRHVRYVAFPIFTDIERRWEDRRRRVTMLLPLAVRSTTLFASPEGNWAEAERREVLWIFPLHLWRRERDGSERTDWIWPLFITRSDAYERTWADLLRFVEHGRRTDGSRWTRILWRIWRSEVSPDGAVTSDYNGLLLRRQRAGDRVRWSFLGGLVTRSSGVDGARWAWFNFREANPAP